MAEEKKKSLATWDPFEELGFGRGLDLFGRREGSRLARLLEGGLGVGLGEGGRLMPAIDISENDSHYVVTAELPGAGKDDVTVEAHDGMLTIRGEKRCEREEKKEQARWVERSFGSFSRSFRLPDNAAADRIEAKFKDGVLRVEIPKSEESKPKVISIKS